jgi:GNAT superfamily N-acetyltransferase
MDFLFVIKQLEVEQLSHEEIACFELMTEKENRCCFHHSAPLSYLFDRWRILTFAAYVDDQPIGLILACHYAAPNTVDLLSLFVQEKYRHHSIGFALLKALDEKIAALKVSFTSFLYNAGLPWAPTLEHLLAKEGWAKSSLLSVRCIFDAVLFTAPWLHKPYPVPENCELFLWKDLRESERQQLLFDVKQRVIPEALSPFLRENLIDEKSSVGMRNAEGIIGWMINHWTAPDTLQFANLYVYSPYKFLGHSMKLLVESIHLVQKDPPPWAFLEANVTLVDHRYFKFLKRRLIPYAVRVEKIMRTWKS